MGNGSSILLSTFNEEPNILECLERVTRACPTAEILVIHGGRDLTAAIAEKFRDAVNPRVRVIQNYGDTGKGHAIKVGISLAQGDVIAQFDADLQFSADDLSKAIGIVERGEADIVVGSRFMAGADRSRYRALWIRDLGNRVVNGWVSLMVGQPITDVTSGLKAWSRAAIWRTAFRDNGFIYEMEIVVRGALAGLRVHQTPATYFSREQGVSGHGSGLKEVMSLGKTGWKILWGALLIRLKLW